MAAPALLACDWGNTHLRAWTLDRRGRVVARRTFDLGVLRLQPGEAGRVFETVVPHATAFGPRPTSAAARALPWAVAAAFAVVAMLVWAPWRTQTPVNRPLVRLDVDLGSEV